MKAKKILAVSLMGAMTASLAGCAVDLSTIDLGKRPSTAAEVVEKYQALMEETKNYHADMEMEFGISAKGEGVTVDLPITMEVSADVLDDNLHGDMKMTMEFMGQKIDQKAEIYSVRDGRHTSTYLLDEDVGEWTVSEDENSADTTVSISGIDPAAFEDAEMEYDKEKGTYTITQSLGDFAEAGDTYELLADAYSGMAEMMNMDPDDFMDEWGSADVIWVFDDEFYLQSMDVDGCEFSDTIKEDGIEMDVSVSLMLSYEFSDYGKIRDKDVEVPDDVIESAVPSETVVPEIVEEPVTKTDEAEPENPDQDEDIVFEEPLDPDFSQEPIQQEETQPGEEPAKAEEPVKTTPVAGNDQFGSINGKGFTLQGDPWTMFADDGWVLGLDDDGEYSFKTADNGAYPDAQLYVNNEAMDHVTAEDIRTNGIYGYTVDFLWSEGKRPNMTWNGVTFGASVADIQAAYGEPYSTYNSTMYTNLTYKIGEAEMDFYITPDNGLQKVAVNVY